MCKKLLAICLAALMVLSILSACGGNAAGASQETTAATEPAEEAKVLKVLTLGHSLAVDSGHMLALVAGMEGYESMVGGTLYYSGCPLNMHVKHLSENSAVYDLYLSSTEEYDVPPKAMESITMQQAVAYDYWDIIVMQGGVFENGLTETYTNGNIQLIQAYVNQHKKNPLAKFAWHMAWALPVDNSLRDTYPHEPNVYYRDYVQFGDDRTTFYNAITKCVNDHILTDDTFAFVIPTGTAFENALSSYLEEKDIHRDYGHATDFTRLIAAYTWYCRLAGVEKLDEIKVDTVPKRFLKSRITTVDWVLTQHEKDLILESVNNALANPMAMTQSQFVTAP